MVMLANISCPKGYKHTEVGVIPEDWDVNPVCAMGDVRAGKALSVKGAGRLRPYLRTANVFDGRVDLYDVLWMPMTDAEFSRYRLRYGDVLLNEGQSLELVGRCAMYENEYRDPCAIQNQLVRFRAHDSVSAGFAAQLFRHCQNSGAFTRIALQTTSVAHLGVNRFNRLQLAWPPTKSEQEAIAEALSDADALIESLEQLLAKKRELKQGAMRELLTGKRRLPGFSKEWAVKRIAEIASPSSEKNSAGDRLTVLTCSKHLGFVDSLGYFKNQVFSKDTGGYKVIRRGQIGYPSIHVEEGSIGLQDLYDVALVSPIYVVFSVTAGIDSYFFHRILKLDSYRQKFATATSSSVDRRGSLRWPAFSEITISLPPVEEQTAIAAIVRDMDAEIAAMETKLTKARQVKQGMMHNLLTGRIRLL